MFRSYFRRDLAIMVLAVCGTMIGAMLIAGLASAAPPPSDSEPRRETQLGTRVADFTLDNCYGKPVTLSTFAQGKPVAIVFLGTECPLAKLYSKRLSRLKEQLGSQAEIVGVFSNKQDSMTELTAFAHRHGLNFPILKDVGNRVADAMGARRTPEVFLIDGDSVVRYHGRVDDQYGVGYSRKKADRDDLAEAMQQLISGDSVAVAETEVVGCLIGRIKPIAPSGEITYSKHIAPILNARCVNCHREQEIAPFTLTRYEDVLGWEETILEVLDDGRMPPWFADPAHGEFANDARITESEKQLIFQWVDNGMPEGDPADLPEPPQFSVGWQIPEPEEVFMMSDKPFRVPAEGVVDYQNYVVDPGWNEDKYIIAAETRPQNRAVVHHILVFVVPPKSRGFFGGEQQLLAGYAPGTTPLKLENGVAQKVEAGSKLLFQMHYTPTGEQQTDLSYLGVTYTTKDKVEKIVRHQAAANPLFRIPPRADNYPVKARYRAKQDEWLTTMTPHMHLRGKSFQYEATYPNGESEMLLSVPNYDFNWQLEYVLKEPKLLPKGTIIDCRATYDNSEANLSNPNPDSAVWFGEQSWQEMMIGFMTTIPVESEL